jgi:hypothetical protein
VVGADIEALPLDHRAVAALLNLGQAVGLADAGLARDHGATTGASIRRLRESEARHGQGSEKGGGAAHGGRILRQRLLNRKENISPTIHANHPPPANCLRPAHRTGCEATEDATDHGCV